MKYITRTVWVLSVISLLTDMASEMLYPVMPVYLQSIGLSIVFIGFLEGLAEAVAGLSKGYFGKQSDLMGKRVPFVQVGYALSALSKPMMAVLAHPLWILFSRTLDRIGKGIRTGARDAILSSESTPETKGKVFGFHRSMDTLGAVAGPLFALIYLYLHPDDYRTLFFIAFVPGVLAIAASFVLKEKQNTLPKQTKVSNSFLSFLTYWKESTPAYKKLVGGLLVFALFNSSDIFLLLKAKDAGLDDAWVIGIYIFYNLVYALFAFPLGIIADRVGLKKMFIVGLLLFAVVYLGIGLSTDRAVIIALFFVYGIYAAATEGISKAWITNLCAHEQTATAVGTYSALQSVMALMASSIAGLIWYTLGASATFYLTGIIVLFLCVYFVLIVKEK